MIKGGFKKVRAIDLGPKPIPALEPRVARFFNFQQNLWSGIIARKWQTFFFSVSHDRRFRSKKLVFGIETFLCDDLIQLLTLERVPY